MSDKAIQRNMPVILIGLFFFMVAILSGAIPWAILFGTLAFMAALALFRQLQPALLAGISVAVMITVVGILNVLTPGWLQGWIEVAQTAL